VGLAAAVLAAAAAAFEGKIVFTSDRDGNQEIYLLAADGSGVARLTNNGAYDDQPALSPGGESVVFVSNRDGNHELYLVGADGKGLRRLTKTDYSETDPAFSPDGDWVIYTSMAEGDRDVWRLRLATGETEKLLGGEDHQFMARSAADGALVYVQNGRDEEVYVYANGTKTNLTATPGLDTMPSFSPDGKVVYFTSGRGGDYDLFAVNRDGTGLREIVALESLEGRASASPTGDYLVVASDRDGDLELYVYTAQGELLEQLTSNEYDDYEPFWGK
jgi:TolB protein